MRRLSWASVLVMLTSFFCSVSLEAADPETKLRICVKGYHDTGMRSGKRAIACAKCEVRRGSEALERGCRDFYDPKQALKYWDKYCCD